MIINLVVEHLEYAPGLQSGYWANINAKYDISNMQKALKKHTNHSVRAYIPVLSYNF